MSKLIGYLFYKLYKMVLKTPKKDIALWATVVLVTWLTGFNILVIYFFLRKIDLIPKIIFTADHGGIFMLCLISINYFVFIYKNAYRQILTRYENESDHERKRGNIIIWAYIITSYMLLFVIAWFRPGKI